MATKQEKLFQKVVQSVFKFEQLHNEIGYKKTIILTMYDFSKTPKINDTYKLTQKQIDFIIKSTEDEIEQLTIERDKIVNNFDTSYTGWKESILNEK